MIAFPVTLFASKRNWKQRGRHLCQRRVSNMIGHESVHCLSVICQLQSIKIKEDFLWYHVGLGSESQVLLVHSAQTFENVLYWIELEIWGFSEDSNELLGPLSSRLCTFHALMDFVKCSISNRLVDNVIFEQQGNSRTLPASEEQLVLLLILILWLPCNYGFLIFKNLYLVSEL